MWVRRAGRIREECKTKFFYLIREERGEGVCERRKRGRIRKWVRVSAMKKRVDTGPETTRTVRTRIDDIGVVEFFS